MDIDHIEAGYLRMLLRMDRKKLHKKRQRLIDRFGEEADTISVDVKLARNADLQKRLKSL